MAELNSWHTILLDGCGDIVACKLYVLHHHWMQARILELANRSDTDIALLMNINGG
jgi:hypothetical protein